MTHRRIPRDVAEQVAELWDREAGALTKYAVWRTAGQGAAADLVQRTFMAAAEDWIKLADLDDDARRSWLRRVCKNKWIDDCRRSQRGRDLHPQVHRLYERSEPDPADIVIAREDLARCWQVFEQLPPVRRQVALLYFVDGHSDLAIAELLGTGASNVRKHVALTRKTLRAALGEAFGWATRAEGVRPVGREQGETA
ncbi:RNA polymerase sigma factor [Streptomyces sp. NPDC093225]|uniref:RNA polymerase sigma factor n=1 Tax=Streptomyces sp. NPDC093225 TaxID=3366034 RepID=UPI00382A8673